MKRKDEINMTCVCSKNQKFKVYDIDNTCRSEYEKYFDYCFEVDPLIASSVALLNEKGYITEIACSEHFHNRIICDSYIPEEKPNGTIFSIPQGELIECYVETQIIPHKSVICFKEEQHFSTLPQDWNMKKNICLYHTYEKDLSEFDFYIQQIMAIKHLYEWADNLERKETEK